MTQVSGPDQRARFLQDWTELWMEEIGAQAADPASAEIWRAAMALWSGAPIPGHDPDAPPGPQANAAAPEPRDSAIERLAARVAELEARIGRLEQSGGGQ